MKPIAIIKLGDTYPEIAARIGGFANWVAAGFKADNIPRRVTDITAGAPLPRRAASSAVFDPRRSRLPPMTAGAGSLPTAHQLRLYINRHIR
ncbi:MAG: hypothetical protein ABIL58_22990 [Pseudomonadota bacterium]